MSLACVWVKGCPRRARATLTHGKLEQEAASVRPVWDRVCADWGEPGSVSPSPHCSLTPVYPGVAAELSLQPRERQLRVRGPPHEEPFNAAPQSSSHTASMGSTPRQVVRSEGTHRFSAPGSCRVQFSYLQPALPSPERRAQASRDSTGLASLRSQCGHRDSRRPSLPTIPRTLMGAGPRLAPDLARVR